MTNFETVFTYVLIVWALFLLAYILVRARAFLKDNSGTEINYTEAYDRDTENTLINLSEMAHSDENYKSMLLSAIYRELRRQGRHK